jgi:hypothetical protein
VKQRLFIPSATDSNRGVFPPLTKRGFNVEDLETSIHKIQQFQKTKRRSSTDVASGFLALQDETLHANAD